MIPESGQVLAARYALLRKVGDGRTAEVWLARDREARLDRVLEVLDRIDGRTHRVHLTPVWQRSNAAEVPALAEYCRRHAFHIGGNPICLRQAAGVVRQDSIDESLWFNKAALLRFEEDLERNRDVHTMGRVLVDDKVATPRCEAHHEALKTAFRLMYEKRFARDPALWDEVRAQIRRLEELTVGGAAGRA